MLGRRLIWSINKTEGRSRNRTHGKEWWRQNIYCYIMMYYFYYILCIFIHILRYILYIINKCTKNIYFRFKKSLILVIRMGRMWPRTEARSNPLCRHFNMPAQPHMNSLCRYSETERRLYYLLLSEDVLILPNYATKS